MNRRMLLKTMAGASGLMLAPAAYGQKAGRWLRLESPNFVVFSTASEKKSREEVAALEGFHTLLTKLMPRSTMSRLKLTVYMTESEKDFLATNPAFKDTLVAGFYSPNLEEVFAVSGTTKNAPKQRDMPKNIRADDARTTLFHEYAHHYVFANSRKPYPSWYLEGFAEFLSTVEFKNNSAEIGKFTMGRAYWLQRGDWLDLETLLTRRPYELSGDQSLQFYAQAWLLTHMLFVKNDRARGFDRYIDALQGGGDALGSFENAFGLSLEDLEKELLAYKKTAITFWRMEGAAPNPGGITVQRLGASADELLLAAVYLRGLPDRDGAAPTVARVQAEARKHPEDPFAMRVSVLADIGYGDLGVARSKLDKLISFDNAAETHHLSGLCDLRRAYTANDEALFATAQAAFGRAHSLDGTRVPSMYRYVECGLSATGEIGSHLLDVLVAACNLAPQVSAVAVTTASALMANQRFDEAQIILRPIASNPHGGEMAALAADMIESASAEEVNQFVFVGGLSQQPG